MGNKLELKGQTFGRLEVIKEDAVRNKDGRVRWLCKCVCGKEITVVGKCLKSGDTKSCGCIVKELASKAATLRNTTHGLSGHPLHSIWLSMKGRCNTSGNSTYKNYGGKGIKVCEEWLDDFMNFYKDMKGEYKKGLQIDRIDNGGNYEVNNCRWVTNQQNQANKGSKVGSTSKYKGVFWCKDSKIWKANIYHLGKNNILGYFTCEKEAALVYNKKAYELNGEYAYLNKIED
jgi:hypothetical protein